MRFPRSILVAWVILDAYGVIKEIDIGQVEA